jgi:hypothetical protein
MKLNVVFANIAGTVLKGKHCECCKLWLAEEVHISLLSCQAPKLRPVRKFESVVQDCRKDLNSVNHNFRILAFPH